MSLRCATLRLTALLSHRTVQFGGSRQAFKLQRPLINRSGRVYLHTTSTLNLPKVVPYYLSDIGEGIVEVVVKEWFVKPGDKISQFDPVCEVQSDKASVTITSRYDGHVEKIHYKVDDVAKVGQPLLDIKVNDDVTDGAEKVASVSSEEVLQEVPQAPPSKDDRYHHDKALATPAVRKMAKESKIDLSQVSATGKGRRVLKDDVINYINQTMEKPSGVPQNVVEIGDRVEQLIGIKKAMFKTMTEAWKIPHFSFSDELDVTDLLTFRTEARLDQKAGVKVTYLPFLIKAVSLALLRYPSLNSHMDETGPRLNIKQGHNIGVAMDTPQGLLVPVIKNVQQRDVIQIAKELSRLQLLAGQNRLGVEDLSGGTITLSNIGSIGGTHASPVLLPPQIVIGAITKIRKLPRYNKANELVPRDLLTVSWAADHRAVDGATVARFSNLFKLYLTSPNLLLLL